MGSGAEVAARRRSNYLSSKGEKVGVVKVRLFRPFSMEHLVAALPKRSRPSRFSIARKSRAPRASRCTRMSSPPSPRRRQLASCPSPCRRSSAAATVCRRRNSPRPWSRPCSTSSKKPAAQEPLHGGHQRRRDPYLSSTSTPTSRPSPTASMRCLFYGLGSDGTVGANKNSIKIIGEDTEILRPGLLRLRLEEGRRGHRLAPALRARRPIRSSYLITQAQFVACHQWSFLERYDMLAGPPAGRRVPAQQRRTARTRSGTSCRVEVQQADHRQEAASFYVIDAYEVAEGDRHGRAHQHHHADLLLRHLRACCHATRPSRRSRTPSRRPTASKGEEVVQKNYARRRQTVANLHRGQSPRGGVAARSSKPPVVATEAPEFVQKVTADDHRGPGRQAAGQRLPGGRHVPHRHRPVGKAQHRAGDPGVGPGAVHPVQQVRAGLPARGHPRQGLRSQGVWTKQPATFKSMTYKGKEFDGQAYTIQVAPEDCTGCGCAWRSARRKDKNDPSTRRINMAAAAAICARPSARTTPSSSTSPRWTAVCVKRRHGQGLAVPAAPVRVLGRLRRLRRDALHQAAHPALRRPGASSPTPPVARRSTAATCPPRRTRRTRTAAARPGPTRCSRTTPSSVWASA